jgi:hypothetical protein
VGSTDHCLNMGALSHTDRYRDTDSGGYGAPIGAILAQSTQAKTIYYL